MHIRQWINEKIGIEEPDTMLDPSVYSQSELEEDRFEAKIQRQKALNEMQDLEREKESLKDQGVGAPPTEKESIATEMEAIDAILPQHKAAFQEATDELALLRIVDALRSRMNTGQKHYEQAMQGTETASIEAEVKSVAQDLNRDNGKVNAMLKELKVSTRISNSSDSSRGKSKYVEEMERREDEREYSASDTESSSRSRQPEYSDD